jgi:hypothetical protein
VVLPNTLPPYLESKASGAEKLQEPGLFSAVFAYILGLFFSREVEGVMFLQNVGGFQKYLAVYLRGTCYCVIGLFSVLNAA